MDMQRIQGNFQRALAMYKKSLALMRESRDIGSIVLSLAGIALVKGKQGDLIKAIRLFGTSNKTFPIIKNDLLSLDVDEYDHIVDNARNTLGEDAFTSAWNEGFAMSLSQAIELAMMVDVSM